MIALLAIVASAHQPHGVLVDAAAGPNGEVLAILDPHDASNLLLSLDDGAHWDFIGGAPTDDELVGVAWSGDLAVVAAREGRLWLGQPGAAWVPLDLANRPLVNDVAAGGGLISIATERGLVYGDAASLQLTNLRPELSFSRVAYGNGIEFVAITGGGQVFWSRQGGSDFAPMESLPEGRTALYGAIRDGVVYVGTLRDIQTWQGDHWDKCGALPLTVSGETALETWQLVSPEPGIVYAATAGESAFVSTDFCKNWTLIDTGDRPEITGAIGDLANAEEAYTFLDVQGDRILVGGYDGVFRSEDGGESWTRPKLISALYSRGIAALSWNEGLRVYQGEYGGGATWSDDGGATWTGSAVGLQGIYGNDLLPEPFAAQTGRTWYVTDLETYFSDDFGENWHRVEVPIDRQREIRHIDERTFILGGDVDLAEGVERSRIVSTGDLGETWDDLPGWSLAAGSNAVLDLLQSEVNDETVWLGLLQKPAQLLVGDADGNWNVVLDTDGLASAVRVWPVKRPTRILVATTAGVLFSDDVGETWNAPTAPPSGHPRDLAATDDGTLVLVTRDGQWWRSEDGGTTWIRAGGLIPAEVHDIDVAPDFANQPLITIGTYAGAYWSDDAADTWHAFPRYERFEAGSYHLFCQRASGEPCVEWSSREAGLGGGITVFQGDEMRFSFNGTGFQILGTGEGLATVDGRREDLTDGGLFDLDDGWHDVVLTAASEDGLAVDAIEATGPGEAAPVPEYPRTCRCGNGNAASGIGLMLIAAVGVWRRRR